MRRTVVFTQTLTLTLNRQRLSSRAAFTLIELLVVISIIATLMSLILPAIQNAREAGRRTQCLNNIRNVTLACMNFASSNPKGHLPALSYYPNDPTGSGFPPPFQEGWSWVVEILPYMDQQGTYDRWDKALPWNSSVTNINGAVNANLAGGLYIEALACPNDESAFQVSGGLTYVANAGFGSQTSGANSATDSEGHAHFNSQLDWNSNGDSSVNDTEDQEISFHTGVFWPHFTNNTFVKSLCTNRCTAPGKIYDGSSNTLMLGENVNAGQTNWANPSLNSCGFMFPLESGPSAPTDTNKASRALLNNTPTGVKLSTAPFPNQKKAGPEGAPFLNSNHPGVVVISMCDGSARTISESLDKKVYTQLMTPGATRLRTLAGNQIFSAEKPLSGDSF
jgi:prepilin-type N-terminal cleavage/methylation domain-containing protein